MRVGLPRRAAWAGVGAEVEIGSPGTGFEVGAGVEVGAGQTAICCQTSFDTGAVVAQSRLELQYPEEHASLFEALFGLPQ